MAEFKTMYYQPMDRAYLDSVTQSPPPATSEKPAFEKPIFSIRQLGETVPENDQQGRNIIQTTQAAIRGGAGTLQLVMTTPHESAIGGRFKAMGKEVRETLREIALANNVNIAGVELPTSLKNLSGFDAQQGVFSEESRRRGIEEVKDAIKFVADVAQGGGVDLVSWEFSRQVNEASWNKGKGALFENTGEQQAGFVVDKRTGRMQGFRTSEAQHLPLDKEFKPIPPDASGKVILREVTWEEFKTQTADYNKKAEKFNKENPNKPPMPLKTPEILFVEKQYEAEATTAEGFRLTNEERARDVKEAMDALQRDLDNNTLKAGVTPERAAQEIKRAKEQYNEFLNSARGQAQQAQKIREQIKNLTSLKEYGLAKSTEGYAEAGITALRETQTGIKKGTVKEGRPIHVGPEIGWPEYYGSHPEEFIELIKESRKEMVQLLTKPVIKDKITGQETKNLYFDPSLNEQRAKQLAKTHIKGLFDTSHMGMWLAHFKPEIDKKTGTLETEERRIERFNGWFKEQVKKIASDPDELVGGIQLVDSMSAAHGHLPPGEGIFPVMDAAKIFQEAGYKGFLVSEGHEEEKFGQGRIRMKTWQKAGANIGSGYFGGPALRWGPSGSTYFGKSYSPLFMFGSYAPSNDFKLWSEVPLE